MAKKNNQKIKLLMIYDILKRETDEEHPMSTQELIERLAAFDIPVERKALYEDIKILNAAGFEVLTVREKANLYYVVDRSFDNAELKVLLDAVQAAGFITEKKTAVMIDKIAALAGAHKAELLKQNLVCFDTVKHSNENIFYNIDTIDNCILGNLKCSFVYFDYDYEGHRAYRRNKDRYLVNPVALVFSEDNYYLLAYNDKYENITAYRVDRMDRVQMEGESVKAAKWLTTFNVAKYRKQAFSMFSGELVEVALECENSVIDMVVDKFGERVGMLKLDENHFRFKAKIQVSPTFFGWLATLGCRAKLIAPQEVVEQYAEHLKKCLESL